MPFRVHIDRIEAECVVLVAAPEGRETVTLPARFLPAGAREGDALDLSLEPAPEDPTRAEVAGLLRDVFGRGDVV
jgi:hypothetical protein